MDDKLQLRVYWKNTRRILEIKVSVFLILTDPNTIQFSTILFIQMYISECMISKCKTKNLIERPK